MFEEIINVANINGFCEMVFDAKIKNDKLSHLNQLQIQQIICDITHQTKMKPSKGKLYMYAKNMLIDTDKTRDDCSTIAPFNILKHLDNELMPIIKETSIMLAEIVTLEILIDYLTENINVNYVVLPVLSGETDTKVGHLSFVILDNTNKLAYYIDSNGTQQNKLAENIIKQYFVMISKHNLNYDFIPSDIWNNENIELNIDYNNDEISSNGNCMIWSLLIMKLINDTHKSPAQIFNDLKNLTDEEKIFGLSLFGDNILQKYCSF